MVKQGIKNTADFMGWMLRDMAWISIQILKLLLAVFETALLLTGSVMKILLLVLA